MSRIYGWVRKHRKTARILILVIPTILIAGLSVPAFLFIPGFLDGLRELHRLNAAGFYGFMVLAVIAAASAMVWSCGDAWERMEEILYPGGEQGADD